jgi:hypothetical protein
LHGFPWVSNSDFGQTYSTGFGTNIPYNYAKSVRRR